MLVFNFPCIQSVNILTMVGFLNVLSSICVYLFQLVERIKAPSDFMESIEQINLTGLPAVPARPNMTLNVSIP